jgi:hypothetical protein
LNVLSFGIDGVAVTVLVVMAHPGHGVR